MGYHDFRRFQYYLYVFTTQQSFEVAITLQILVFDVYFAEVPSGSEEILTTKIDAFVIGDCGLAMMKLESERQQ